MWPQPAPLGLRPLHFNNPEKRPGCQPAGLAYHYKIVMSGKLNFSEFFWPAPPRAADGLKSVRKRPRFPNASPEQGLS